jgi:hypothetical protein
MLSPALNRSVPQKCTSKVGALEAQIRLLDAEIIDLVNDIVELEARRDELEHQQGGFRALLGIFLAGQEEGGR